MSRPTRRLDVDWLRILAVYLLFPFHVAKVYDATPWYHLKNEELSVGLSFFTGFVHQWHMRLLFLLAGWSLLASLLARGREGFSRSASGSSASRSWPAVCSSARSWDGRNA